MDSLETLKLALQEEHRDFLAQFPVAFLQLLARTSEWQRLVRFAERQETGDNECDAILKHRSMGWDPVSLRAMAIRVVARSDDLSKEETKAQQAISEFLRRHLVSDRKAKPDERQQVQMLHKYLSVEEGGAALERANRLTFALEYYEQWFTETQFPNKVFRADKTKLRHARTRWVVCKRRLGDVTSGPQSEKHLQEAAISERRWSLSKENQPEIPKLAPLAGTVSLVDIVEADTEKPSVKEVAFKDKTEQKAELPGRDFNVSFEIQMEGRRLRGQLERRKRRLILTDLEKEDHVTCGPEQVSSQDLQVVENGAGRWQIATWGLVCELERFGESVKVRFFDPGSGELYFGIEL